MRINFDTTGSYKLLENSSNNSVMSKNQNSVEKGVVYKSNQNNKDSSGINNVYDKNGKSKEDIMKAAESINLDAQSDFMTLMSNTMSNEDFQKMCQDGFDPSEMTAEETITVSDRIKAAMMAGGTYIPGYTDQLSGDILVEITGNEGLATQIQEAFQEKNALLNQKNVEETMELIQMSEEITPLSTSQMLYMVQEGLEATVNNIYKAQYALGDNNYEVQLPESDWQALKPEAEKILNEAGLEVNEGNLNIAKNLLEKDIPLTKENINKAIELNYISYPIDAQKVIDSVAIAIADGKLPKEGNLIKEKTNWQQAEELYREISDMPEAEDVHSKRVLEETRLIMTIDANKKLIENNVAIDTSNLEKLVENLKEIEKQTAKKLFPDQDDIKAVESLKQFDDYGNTISEIKAMPLATVSLIADKLRDFDLPNIAKQGTEQRLQLEQRDQAYETFMTVPRADLGDRISDAFRNIGSLLEEIGLESTDENQRAARSLGYNSMEITKENVELVKEADMTLQNVINRMTPSAVLKMIRDGVNPLERSIEDIDNYLTSQDNLEEKEQKKYSQYLYDLEKNNEITNEEREGYIGIYRLLRQVEKTDGAALGSLINQGSEINFDNLLHAVRSRKAKRTDIKVDDNTIVKIKGLAENPIDAQINSAFNRQLARFEEKRLESDLEEIARELKEQGEESYQEYTRQIYVNEIMESPVGEAVLSSILQRLDESPTLENLYYMSDFWKNSGKIYERIKEVVTKENQEDLEEEARKLAGNFDESESVIAYEDFLLAQRSKLEKNLETKKDITFFDAQTTGLLYKQIGFAIKSVKENHYHFPIEIGNQISCVNLTLKKSLSGKESIEASMDTEKLGKLSINLSVSGEKIAGIIVHERKGYADIISALEKNITSELKTIGFDCDKIYSASNEKMEINPFDEVIDENYKLSRTSVNKLFSIAKRMLKTVSDTLK